MEVLRSAVINVDLLEELRVGKRVVVFINHRRIDMDYDEAKDALENKVMEVTNG